jgi:hypothetical protein
VTEFLAHAINLEDFSVLSPRHVILWMSLRIIKFMKDNDEQKFARHEQSQCFYTGDQSIVCGKFVLTRFSYAQRVFILDSRLQIKLYVLFR